MAAQNGPDQDAAFVVEARDVTKTYGEGALATRVLDGVSAQVRAGRIVAVMGPSGSGKSTLLHLLGGLDVPDEGDMLLEGESLSGRSDADRTKLRRGRIGIVYQFFNLVPVLSAEENVALPAVIAGRKPRSYRQRLDDVLELVGLSGHRRKQPSELSGGEQQRVAIARALFIDPAVLLADEPTGNLDLRTGADILRLFVGAQRHLAQTVVIVTHDPRTAAHADEVLLLRGGRIGGHLEIARRCRGPARTEPGHEGRVRAVLRWLEELDAGPASAKARPARPRTGAPA